MLVNLNEVLKDAQKNHYAVGLFNTTDSDMIKAAIEAAEENNSPIIIGTAEVLLPYGELDLIGPSLVEQAKRAKVPVVVNFDHGMSFDLCLQAMKIGFSSIMFDASTYDYETNVSMTREMVKIAHSYGVSVEGEIGHVGLGSAGDNATSDMYTTPKEALDFAEATGVDALAVAIGTAHGVYKVKPKLDLERLAQIRATVDTPLVLHGGSGLTDDDFRNAIAKGIAKLNIHTDICNMSDRAMKLGLEAGLTFLTLRNLKKDAVKMEITKKMKLFGSVNRA